ncbi:MAG TPA: signal peptidase I [Candidatus Eremiobacteraceae bacterium]|nr:signal peptidase I [Candidatus Eremiobacteraceae bacterium]
MTPSILIAVLCVLAIARAVLWIAPNAIPDDKSRAVTREYLDAFLIAGVVALLLMRYVIRTFYIPSGSMEPTLKINDVLLASEIQYGISNPQLGQIAVFIPPPELGTTDFIKRVMGTPGDRLRIHNGVVIRNGQPVNEPYLPAANHPDYELEIKNYDIWVDGIPLDPTRAQIPPKKDWQAPDRIPNGWYFMMGDNRNNSDDSHLWGFIARDKFVGHAFLVFWPFSDARLLH